MSEEGEETLLLQQIHKMSKDILEDLEELDNRIVKIVDLVNSQEIDRDLILEKLNDVRTLIGSIEKEDAEEMKDEEIVENINRKLRDLIKMALG